MLHAEGDNFTFWGSGRYLEHGQALLEQGVEGGLQPDGQILEELIKCLCRKEMHGSAYKAVTETMKVCASHVLVVMMTRGGLVPWAGFSSNKCW